MTKLFIRETSRHCHSDAAAILVDFGLFFDQVARPSRLVLGKKFFQIQFIYTREGCYWYCIFFFLQSVIYETPYCALCTFCTGQLYESLHSLKLFQIIRPLTDVRPTNKSEGNIDLILKHLWIFHIHIFHIHQSSSLSVDKKFPLSVI